MEHGPAEPVPIRRSDRLHADALDLARATDRLRRHYADLAEAARQASQIDESEGAATQWLAAIEHLRDLDSRARI